MQSKPKTVCQFCEKPFTRIALHVCKKAPQQPAATAAVIADTTAIVAATALFVQPPKTEQQQIAPEIADVSAFDEEEKIENNFSETKMDVYKERLYNSSEVDTQVAFKPCCDKCNSELQC